MDRLWTVRIIVGAVSLFTPSTVDRFLIKYLTNIESIFNAGAKPITREAPALDAEFGLMPDAVPLVAKPRAKANLVNAVEASEHPSICAHTSAA